jgi:ACR3 family arsenite transporter
MLLNGRTTRDGFVWAAASFGLPPLAEGYVAACVIPVLALPLIIKLCLRLPSFGRFVPQN